MDVNERIKKQLDTYPVLLYMKGTPDFPQCGFSAKTVSVLRAAGAKFAFDAKTLKSAVDLLEEEIEEQQAKLA